MKTRASAMIREAKWVTCPKEYAAPVIRRTIAFADVKKCEIALSSLGFFTLYINGKRVGDEYFRPSVSLYRERNGESWLYPISDRFTYRCYYPLYDITGYLQEGENLFEIALGDGWYRQTERTIEGNMAFGDELGAVYAVCGEDGSGEFCILSDGSETCSPSPTVYSQLFIGEIYDARLENAGREESPVRITELPGTELTPDTAPPDRVMLRIEPKLIFAADGRRVYDTGENISGFAVIRTNAAPGEEVLVRYSENISGTDLDFASTGSGYVCSGGKPQIMEDRFIGDGGEHIFRPSFLWHAFRYFEIIGCGEAETVEVIHSDTPVLADFSSSSPELNWLFDAYIRTQTNNMHGSIPSDCPHRERLGYTGDGQVCAPAAMLMLDTREFYRKWIRDIFDSQDGETGHVNHTAPFMGGGGGPGGWGCAAVFVPYYFVRAFGDDSVVREYFDRMLLWIGYLRAHSENGLVVREEEKGWCLGDWCTLDRTVIPTDFVNTCCMIKALGFLGEMAEMIGRKEDAAMLENLRRESVLAVIGAYYDEVTHSFAGGEQGADAFALWAGLGDEVTYANLRAKYGALGHYDTGFICTDILNGLLFENGDEDIAFRLLTSHEPGSFGFMMDHGATTVWEHWLGDSNDHPMFGASARYLITHILGIGEGVIAPKVPAGLEHAEGYLILDGNQVSVSWRRTACGVDFDITVPGNCRFRFAFGGREAELEGGHHVFSV